MKAVGARLPRYDGMAHVTGRTQYVADWSAPGMLACKGLRSPHHSARILSIDTSRAEKLPGVRAVVTHKDMPKNIVGHLEALGVPADEPYLAVDEVRYKGQLDRRRGGERRGHRDGGARADRRRVRGAHAVPRHPQGVRSPGSRR